MCRQCLSESVFLNMRGTGNKQTNPPLGKTCAKTFSTGAGVMHHSQEHVRSALPSGLKPSSHCQIRPLALTNREDHLPKGF